MAYYNGKEWVSQTSGSSSSSSNVGGATNTAKVGGSSNAASVVNVGNTNAVLTVSNAGKETYSDFSGSSGGGSSGGGGGGYYGGGSSGGGGGGDSGGGGASPGAWSAAIGSTAGTGTGGTGAGSTDPSKGVEAGNDLLKNAGYDFTKPLGVESPDLTLKEADLSTDILLPNKVDIPEDFDYDAAMAKAKINMDRINHVDTEQEEAMLKQITDAQKEQAVLQADRAVNEGIINAQRTMQDAQNQFQTQRDQIAADEQRALDNQALYAEARGDRGGIGQAQYNTIQNTAATNRLTVQKEQTKLATDTARQIADLRSQGEFEKANQLLSITQNYLSQLMNLYTWAKETNLGIDEFNLQVGQWEENYKLSLLGAQLDVQNANLNLANMRMNQENALFDARMNAANYGLNVANYGLDAANYRLNAANYGLNAANQRMNEANARLNAQLNVAEATGAFSNGASTYAAQQKNRELLAASGQALMEAGVAPTAAQLEAMGMTTSQAASYLQKYFPGGPVVG